MRTLRPLIAASALVSLAGCTEDASNFSQHPGFAEWYARHPPAERAPAPEDQALLARYLPRFHLPEGQEGPLDFYADFVAHGSLSDARGDVLSEQVTPALLDRWKTDPGVVFVHEPGEAPDRPTPVVYGRIDRARLDLPGCADPLEVAFLTYHLAFRVSGLPAGTNRLAEFALAAVADLDDWHQLDHYTAVTLAVADAARPVPFAATFQHHNYMRTWLLAPEAAAGRVLALPADGRIEVDVAIRSNELYPHVPGRTVRRAVRFLDAESAVYLVTGKEQPFAAADDVTEPAREIDPELRFLPPADAFYVFEGWLGERRLLPGRDGPPGADYNTLPALKPKPVQLMAFFWSEDELDYLDLLKDAYADGRPSDLDLEPFARRFEDALRAVRPDAVAC